MSNTTWNPFEISLEFQFYKIHLNTMIFLPLYFIFYLQIKIVNSFIN